MPGSRFLRTVLSGLLAALPLLVLPLAPAGAQPAEEVPFVVSPDNVTLEMLRLAGIGPGDHLIDLGSGDGRIVIVAAQRFGATGLGVEIVPELVERSLRSAREAGVADRVAFRVQDLFATDLSPASVVTLYLLPEFNLQLRPRLLQLKPGTRVVSHDWDMGDWTPDRTTVVAVPDKKVGLEKSSRIHLWTVPARVEGLWCGTGLLQGSSLRLAQRYQVFEGTLLHRGRERPLQGRVEGATVRTVAGRYGELALTLAGDELRLASAEGVLALAKGTTFRRSTAASCASG
ncbi:SAM-dependent methyltransferase [Ramlibacter tataouinensis]|uniref:Methyltransferase domain-containing protein n=1 Tax=Ramlibacter tataouinensis (strain ATCC BAA-407 / DSM 14655 / LMG 21543 / TTB310) TaxID=365046 RepID=F5Y515_RAMTT|nr:methyltransferase domain-containing protein [Ramlibacter tataouinensis]AEG93855.1 Conserved hypothetical protein [Ramlibacter tataouinensis TTB310]